MQEVTIKGWENDELCVALTGDIDLGNAEEFYQEVTAAYAKTPANVCFACDGLNFIDSTTLGTFVKIMKAVKADGFGVRLVGLQPKIKKLFLICGLDAVMEIA
ncbi:MAG: STAS domain-containing protein [Clostridia bacterium]|nr:STAS domain-containing protein [Clostridia bacterium]